jgi:hypothetical protein
LEAEAKRQTQKRVVDFNNRALIEKKEAERRLKSEERAIMQRKLDEYRAETVQRAVDKVTFIFTITT